MSIRQVIAFLLIMLSGTWAWGVLHPAVWNGAAGNGLYSDKDNWVDGVVPINTATDTYNVMIGPGVTVYYDVDGLGEVTDLSLGANSLLQVNPGKSLTVLDDAMVYGEVTANNSTFLAQAPAAQFPGNAARLAVTGGGTIAVAAPSYSATGLTDSYTLFSAADSGSLLDLSSLTSIDAYVNRSYVYTHTISATGNGKVDLSGVQTVRGRAGDDWLRFVANTNGVLDLSSLQSITAGNTAFDLDVANFSLPALQNVTGTAFNLSATTAVWAGALTSMNGSTINMEAGSTWNAASLTSFTNSTLHLKPGMNFNSPAFTDADNSRIAVSDGASLTVADASFSSTGLTGTYELFTARGTGSALDLSAMTSLDAYVGAGYVQVHTIAAQSNGQIDLSGLETIRGRQGDDRLDFVVDTGGAIDLSSLANTTAGNTRFAVDAASFTLPALTDAVGTTFDMTKTSSTLSLPLLESQNGGAHNVPERGTFELPELTSLTGVTISIDPCGVYNAPKLTSFTNGVLGVRADMAINTPAFTDVDNSRIAATAGGVLTVADTTYSSTGLTGTYELFTSRGDNSLLDLSAMTSLDAYVGAGYVQVHTIAAQSNGQIDLSGLETVRGRQGDDRLDFVVDTGGAIDLSSLVSTTAGNTRFAVDADSFTLPALTTAVGTTFDMARTQSTLSLPVLESQNGGAHNVPEEGTFDLPELTSLTGVTISIGPDGVYDAPKLTSFTGGALGVRADMTINTPAFTDVDNSRIAATDAGVLTVADTSYSSTGLGGTYELFAARGTDSRLDLSAMTSLDAYVAAGYVQVHTIAAQSSGHIDLSGLETVRGRSGDDRLDFVVDTGGTMDLSSLVSTTAGNTRFAVDAPSFTLPALTDAVGVTFDMAAKQSTLSLPVLESQNGGAHNVPEEGTFDLPELTSLNGVTINIGPDGIYDAPKLTSFTGGALSVRSDMTFAAPAFTEADNSRFAVTDGASLTVADTSYLSTGLGSTYELFRAQGAGSVLDASAMTSLDAYVSAGYVQTHSVIATNDGLINLSGLDTVRGRNGDDWLAFSATSGGVIDLTSLQTITAGNVRFTIDGGGKMTFGDVTISPSMTVSVTGNTSVLEAEQNLHLDSTSSLALAEGAKVLIGGNFSHDLTDEGRFGTDAGLFQFDGSTGWMEVAGADLGLPGPGTGNFGLAQLIVGSDSTATNLYLTDLIDNGNRSSNEALYLHGSGGLDGLRITAGSRLIIGDINVYSLLDGNMVHINALFGPDVWEISYEEGYIAVPEPGMLLMMLGVVVLGRRSRRI